MLQRQLIPGSEWLYLKIYTGIKTSDVILEETIGPLIEWVQRNDYISQWFFIRYADPKPHLRIRLRLHDVEYYHEVLDTMTKALQKYVDSGEISQMVIDTYTREIERYGKNTMEDAEMLFYTNSALILQCLHYDDEEKIMTSLFYIDELLNILELAVEEKLSWIKDFNAAFKKEFKADKTVNSQLDKKYRALKPKYLHFIQSEEFSDERRMILSNMEENRPALKNIMDHHEQNSLGMSLQMFSQSIFHMYINRLFVSNQRLFEMVIYDYLLRYYKSIAYQSMS